MMQKLRDELTEVKRVKIDKEQKEVIMRSIPKCQNWREWIWFGRKEIIWNIKC